MKSTERANAGLYEHGITRVITATPVLAAPVLDIACCARALLVRLEFHPRAEINARVATNGHCDQSLD